MGSQRGGAARARERRRFPHQHTVKTGGSPVRVGEARERSARELRKGVNGEDGERHGAKSAHATLSQGKGHALLWKTLWLYSPLCRLEAPDVYTQPYSNQPVCACNAGDAKTWIASLFQPDEKGSKQSGRDAAPSNRPLYICVWHTAVTAACVLISRCHYRLSEDTELACIELTGLCWRWACIVGNQKTGWIFLLPESPKYVRAVNDSRHDGMTLPFVRLAGVDHRGGIGVDKHRRS